MGMDTSSKIIVGLPYDELEEYLEKLAEDYEGDIGEAIEYSGLDYASPWYDSDREDWVIGVEVCGGEAVDFVCRIGDAYYDFLKQTNMTPRVFQTPHVT